MVHSQPSNNGHLVDGALVVGCYHPYPPRFHPKLTDKGSYEPTFVKGLVLVFWLKVGTNLWMTSVDLDNSNHG